jgi:hypothetical protein
MSSSSEEYERIQKEIEEKLEANPSLKDEIEAYVDRIEEILGYSVDLHVVYLEGVSDYIETLNEYDDIEISKAMTLRQFIDFLDEEDENLEVNIDPIYLKKGINSINNILLTTVGDKLIIVPKINEKDE